MSPSLSLSISRQQTPPPAIEMARGSPSTSSNPPATPQKDTNANAQLLTPPSTGVFRKIVRFDIDRRSPTKSKRHYLNARKDADESALVEYAELDDSGDDSDISIENCHIASDPPSPMQISLSSVSKNEALVNTSDELLLATPSSPVASIPTSPFPFMKLPLSIRKKVYEALLVVPGLICVRQNHTSYHNEEKAFLYAETRLLLPGIAYALPQITVGGFKARFSRFRYVNAGILRVSKEIHTEAKAVMCGTNDFEIICPNLEMSPPPDYKIPLFPRGYSRYVRSLSIRVRALYPLKWLLNGGYSEIKNAYRGLEMLNVVFEMEDATKGLCKVLGKKEDEQWDAYTSRLHCTLSKEIFTSPQPMHTLPCWIKLRVLFTGEFYDNYSEPTPYNINIDLGPGNASPTDAAEERLRRYHLKRGLCEAFERFKKGTH